MLVQLRIQHLVRNTSEIQHTTQEFGYLDAGRTNKNRPTLLYQTNNLVNYGIVFLTLGAVNTVIEVDTCHRLIGRNNDYVEFIYVPELTCFRLGRTGHTGQLVVHTEVVLQRNRSESLCCTLDLDVFFRFHSLVQTIRPAATFHDTAGLLIDNLHLVVIDDIVHILLEQRVCFEQLVHGVYALGLDREIGQNIILALLFFFRRKVLFLEFSDLRTYVR